MRLMDCLVSFGQLVQHKVLFLETLAMRPIQVWTP